ASRYFTSAGSRNCRAMIRELSRMARAALLMLIEARETASTSCPARNGARMPERSIPTSVGLVKMRAAEPAPAASTMSARTMRFTLGLRDADAGRRAAHFERARRRERAAVEAEDLQFLLPALHQQHVALPVPRHALAP